MKFPLITRTKHQKKLSALRQDLAALKVRLAALQEAHASLRSQAAGGKRRTPSGDPSCHCPACAGDIDGFDDIDRGFLQSLIDAACIQPVFSAENPNLLNYTCPRCGASDRERLIIEHLQTGWRGLGPGSGISVLEIAPGAALSKWIRSVPAVRYRTADLLRDDVDDRVDVTDMRPYADDSFDCVICSHVLEHVPDDRAALRELFRITKPGGECLLLVPILLALEADYENPAATEPVDRWRHFMQDDHVRVYSKPGFVAKIHGAGFVLHELGQDHFGDARLREIGVHPRTILYRATKPATSPPTPGANG